ncbi:MAG: glycosyltransferase family 2 protein [Kiritimatiellia bacterium]
MKVIIQLPCFNEAGTLPDTLKDLPRQLPGVDTVEWLIIDDGSSDQTAQVANENGVDHVIRHTANQGLAKAFMTGLNACLERNADIIVNTDADNQYVADDIPKLIAPILAHEAEMVIGARPISDIEHFSPVKRRLQRFGSAVVRWVSGTDIVDAPSGFRAFSRDAAMRLNVFSNYTYTLETIIQAGHKNISVVSVPIRTNPPTRSSRLMRSMPQYLMRSFEVIVRIFATYRPFRFFMLLGVFPFLSGSLLGLRFLVHYLMGQGTGMIQSLILAALLIGSALLMWALAFLADLISVNRKLHEQSVYLLRKMSFDARGGSGKDGERGA